MILQRGQRITLGRQHYEIVDYLNNGALASTYLARMTGAPEPGHVVVRIAARDTTNCAAADAMRLEAAVLAQLNRAEDLDWPPAGQPPPAYLRRAIATTASRFIIALLDSGETDDRVPFTVQELAPPAFRPPSLRTLEDEAQIIAVAAATARVIALCHDHGMSLRDFDPAGGKADRIRVAWDGSRLANFKVIDWNVTGKADPQARARDLLYFGGQLYQFLTGQPASLANGQVQRISTDLAWRRAISEGSRWIASRLLHPDPQRRYQGAHELLDDLDWWLHALALSTVMELDAHLLRTRSRPERRLAVADLVLRRQIAVPNRQRYEQMLEDARSELFNIDRLALDQGLINLKIGDFRRAEEEFSHRALDPNLSSGIRLAARIYRFVAMIGAGFQDAGLLDVTHHPAWEPVNRAAELLSRRNWQAGLDQLAAPESATTKGPAAEPLTQMRTLAEAALFVERAAAVPPLLVVPPESPSELCDERWENHSSAAHVAASDQACRVIEALVPEDPELRDASRTARERAAYARDLLDRYRQIASAYCQAEAECSQARVATSADAQLDYYRHAERDAARALGMLDSIPAEEGIRDSLLRLHAQLHTRATAIERLRREAEERLDRIERGRAALRSAEESLRSGAYTKADLHAQEALRLAPDLPEARVLYERTQAYLRQVAWVDSNLALAREAIRQGDLPGAQQRLTLLYATTYDVNDTELPVAPFVPPQSGDIIGLRELLPQIEVAQAMIDHLIAARQSREARDELLRLKGIQEHHGLTLSAEQARLLADLDRVVAGFSRARLAIRTAAGLPEHEVEARLGLLSQAIETLGADQSSEARSIGDDAVRLWLALAEQAPTLDSVSEILRPAEGAALPPATKATFRSLDLEVENARLIAAALEPASSSPDVAHPATLERVAELLEDWDARPPALRAVRDALPGWYARLRQAQRDAGRRHLGSRLGHVERSGSATLRRRTLWLSAVALLGVALAAAVFLATRDTAPVLGVVRVTADRAPLYTDPETNEVETTLSRGSLRTVCAMKNERYGVSDATCRNRLGWLPTQFAEPTVADSAPAPGR